MSHNKKNLKKAIKIMRKNLHDLKSGFIFVHEINYKHD